MHLVELACVLYCLGLRSFVSPGPFPGGMAKSVQSLLWICHAQCSVFGNQRVGVRSRAINRIAGKWKSKSKIGFVETVTGIYKISSLLYYDIHRRFIYSVHGNV